MIITCRILPRSFLLLLSKWWTWYSMKMLQLLWPCSLPSVLRFCRSIKTMASPSFIGRQYERLVHIGIYFKFESRGKRSLWLMKLMFMVIHTNYLTFRRQKIYCKSYNILPINSFCSRRPIWTPALVSGKIHIDLRKNQAYKHRHRIFAESNQKREVQEYWHLEDSAQHIRCPSWLCQPQTTVHRPAGQQGHRNLPTRNGKC